MEDETMETTVTDTEGKTVVDYCHCPSNETCTCPLDDQFEMIVDDSGQYTEYCQCPSSNESFCKYPIS